MPNSITSIESNAFRYCESLTSISIPESVAEITYETFRDCANLTIVYLPGSISRIRNWAFMDCNNITDVFYSGNEAQWKESVETNGNEPLLNATIHYNSYNSPMPVEQKETV